MNRIKLNERINTLSEYERMQKIEETLDANNFKRRLEGSFFCVLLFVVGFTLFREYSVSLYVFCIVMSSVFLIMATSDARNKVLKNTYSNNEKINKFIYYTNSELGCSRNTNGAIAIPVRIISKHATYYFIQPILTHDTLDIYLINKKYLLKYRARVDYWEYKELKRMFKTDIEKFNEEIVLRGYDIRLYEE